MAFKAAERGAVPPFIVMDVMRDAALRQAEGGDVIHMEVGQPSGQAPARVREAAAKAIAEQGLGYTLAMGTEALRTRIARHYAETYHAQVDPERICVTTGSSGGFLLSFLAAFEPGDRVAAAAPGYPAYRNILRALGVDCVDVPVGPETRWQLSVQALSQVEGRLDGVIVASPSNPTGSMLSASELRELALWCEAKGVRLISDEIYHGVTYGESAATAAGLSGAPHVTVINSFSKYYAMTGWRLGWMIVPQDLIRSVECLQQNMFISAPSPSQAAAEVAFDCAEELDARVAAYKANRDLLLNELPAAGFGRLAPSDGAFYLYADISDYTEDSRAYCRRLLAETGIAATPGIDFDPARGHRALRFSYAGSMADMAEAARRLKAWKK